MFQRYFVREAIAHLSHVAGVLAVDTSHAELALSLRVLAKAN